MSVENIMATDLVTVGLDSTLKRAKDIFESHSFHHLLVLHDDMTLAGLITDRDLYKHLSPTIGTNKETRQDTLFLRKKMHQIMTRDVITGTPELSLNEAACLFHDHHISCLPIIDNKHRPVGIITWRDIIKVVAIQHKRKQMHSIEE